MAGTEDILAAAIRQELVRNILPFWQGRMRDPKGGFHGAAGIDGTVDTKAPRSAVVNARILWTFSAATRLLGPAYRDSADWAYDYFTAHFVDREYGGVFWQLDASGHPLSDRKQVYAQAFAIYALSEYYRISGEDESLEAAIRLYKLIEQHAADRWDGGYVEARDRYWRPLADMRLSEKDINSPKSMNTHLHVMEAYTNLLRVWPDPELAARQGKLINATLDHIVDAVSGHFKLFFDMSWTPLDRHVSFGHDIEGSWLLVEAAEVLGDETILERVRTVAILMAETALAEGRDADGSLFYEADGESGELVDPNKHWWAQAEALVGFYNAWQMTGDGKFKDAAESVWTFIDSKVADRVHGEWHAKLAPDGRPYGPDEDADVCLAGPWKCPYHNARACFEMIERLAA